MALTPIAGTVSAVELEEAKQDIVIAVQIFEEHARKATLYFAWSEGEKIVPETLEKQEKSFNRFFLETQILFFVVFIAFGMLIFLFLSALYPEAFWIAPLILIAVQFVFVFYSSNFIARTADWHITEANPYIYILKYTLPDKADGEFRQLLPRSQLLAIKKGDL